MTLTPGTRLGPYEVVAAIGAGGMGEVYRAKDARLGREVAVKVLPTSFAGDADRRARFECRRMRRGPPSRFRRASSSCRTRPAPAIRCRSSRESTSLSARSAGSRTARACSTAGGRTRRLLAWTPDRTGVVVAKRGEVPAPVDRVDPISGKRTRLKDLGPPDRTGVMQTESVYWLPDGRGYAYAFYRDLSQVFVVRGVR
jgi:hypothetical protein